MSKRGREAATTKLLLEAAKKVDKEPSGEAAIYGDPRPPEVERIIAETRRELDSIVPGMRGAQGRNDMRRRRELLNQLKELGAGV